MRGSLAKDENAFVTDLNAILEPLTDPANPSFTASGSLLELDAQFLQDLLEKNDMKSGPISITPTLNCNRGILSNSSLDLLLKDFSFHGNLIGDTTVSLPVSGSLTQPSIDLTGAIQSLFSSQTLQIGKTLGLDALAKELGMEEAKSTSDLLTGALTNQIDDVKGGDALQQLIEQVVPGAQTPEAAATNPPLGETAGEALFEQLEGRIKELEGNEDVKQTLKDLGKSLFGK
jgi:hypothetical protein